MTVEMLGSFGGVIEVEGGDVGEPQVLKAKQTTKRMTSGCELLT